MRQKASTTYPKCQTHQLAGNGNALGKDFLRPPFAPAKRFAHNCNNCGDWKLITHLHTRQVKKYEGLQTSPPAGGIRMSEVCLTQLLGVHPTQLLLKDGATEIQQDKGPAQGHIEK